MTDTDARPQRARGSRRREGEGSGWYRIANLADGPARIDIYDEIGFYGCSAQDFLRDLAAVTGPVEVHLNSPGGDPYDGYAIYQALAGRPGVTTVVDSLAASAASIIAMAGEQRLMAKYAQLMIHDAWALSDGNAADLRHMADRLDTVSGQIAGIYADTAGGSPDFWREQMRAETWYTPQQALDAGLITGIAGTGRVPAPASIPAEAASAATGIRAAAQPWDPDGDGDDDSTPEGDTDHSHWSADGKQLKPVPGKPMPGQPPADAASPAAQVPLPGPQSAGVMPLGDGWVQDPDGTIRFDPDGDGDDDSTPAGDTDHDYWAPDGTSLQPVPPCPGMPEARAAHGVQAAGARHEPLAGSHDHPHPAYGAQGGDAMHSHAHEHASDASHDHAHPAAGGAMPGDKAAANPPTSSMAARVNWGLGYIKGRYGSPAAAVDDSPWDAAKAWHNGAEADDPAAFYAGICAGRKAGDKATQAAWALPYKYHPGDPPNAGGVKAALSRLPQTDGLTNETEAKALLQKLMKQVSPDYEPESAAAGTITANPPPAPPAAQPAVRGAATGSTGPHPHPDGHASQEGKTVTTMSIEDRAARRGEIEARLTEIGTEHGDAEFPAEAQAEWDTLTGELDEHGQVLARHEQGLTARRDRLAAIAARQQGEQVSGEQAGFTPPAGGSASQPPPTSRPGVQNRAPGLVTGRSDLSIYDVDGLRKRSSTSAEMGALCRDNALRALERATFPGSESREKAQSTVERLLARVDSEDAALARRILVTGHPLYMKAWGKAVARLSTAVLAPDEIKALSVGTGSDGGFAVPFELDPTVLLTSNGAINPLRQISRVQTIIGKEYDLVTSAGVTVSRSAEASAVANNNPTLAQPTIKAERVTGFVPFSVEIEQDWSALQSEMMMLMADAKDVEESASFTTGTGVSPAAGGIISTLAVGSAVAGTGSSGTLALGDLDALENTVPPRFRTRANWMASKTIYNAYRALMTSVASSAGDQWVRPSLNQPAELRGYPAYEDSDMVATHATNDKVIVLGDFGRGFIIVDRLGMSAELVPHLFDQATARPTGQRGLLLIWRNNSRVIIDNAFRLLKVA
jgi:HK97 family phage major capsid protein